MNPLFEKIRRLAKEKNAIILAHNYQPPEIQQIADLCGDSLELSIRAAETGAAVIVFCGVHFMAETASILSPEKTVLLPKADAGCPMADMVTPAALAGKKKELPGVPVITYVNSTAAVKALSDACCTSANVVKVVNSFSENTLLMVPDRNLAAYAASQTDKTIIAWDGCCPIHDRLTPDMVRQAKSAHPDALFMAHPECRAEVLELADRITSTSGMLDHAASSAHSSFIAGTESGLIYPMQQANPGKQFYPVADIMVCPDMKKITLADVAESLEHLTGEVRVPEEVRKSALVAVKRMLEPV